MLARALLRFTLLVSLAMLLALPGVAAAEPHITVSPESGPSGAAFFNIAVTGLAPGEPYLLLVRDPNGVAHPKEIVASPEGTWFDAWVSEPTEPVGVYTVELRTADGQTVLASATFTVQDPLPGNKPMVIDFDDTFVDPFLADLCGFPVEIRAQGTITIFGAKKDGQAPENLRVTETYTNLETGASFKVRFNGRTMSLTTESEGMLDITFETTGAARLIVPGDGAVYIDAGHITGHVIIDRATGQELLFEQELRGRHDQGFDVCALLAG